MIDYKNKLLVLCVVFFCLEIWNEESIRETTLKQRVGLTLGIVCDARDIELVFHTHNILAVSDRVGDDVAEDKRRLSLRELQDVVVFLAREQENLLATEDVVLDVVFLDGS